MVSISARDCFKSGFKERLKSTDNERAWITEEELEEDLEIRLRRVCMAPSV